MDFFAYARVQESAPRYFAGAEGHQMRKTFPLAGSRRSRRKAPPRWRWAMVAGAMTFLGWMAWELANMQPPPPDVAARLVAPEPARPKVAAVPTPVVQPVEVSQPQPAPEPPKAVVVPVPTPPPAATDLSTKRVLYAQIALARKGLSPGSLDGRFGSQTRAALRALQLQCGLPVTGALDEQTETRLTLDYPALSRYVVTADDLARLQPLSKTWLGKSEQSRLEYESILELVAEKTRSHPTLIKGLNPDINWDNLVAGAELVVPDATPEPPASKAAYVKIYLRYRILQAFGAENEVLAHFPCSIAQRVDKRPVGELRVVVMAPNPNYTFNPDVFPESEEGRRLGRKLLIPPGPNNPVGAVWIGLDRPGYGIHGTPRPEEVGRTESHGCFRLANWNAEYLHQLLAPGTLVIVEP